MDLRQRVKIFCIKQNISYKEFAKKNGFSTSTFYKWLAKTKDYNLSAEREQQLENAIKEV